MPRLHGVRERLHQPFWASLLRITGPIVAPLPPIAAQNRLFTQANLGNLAVTNMNAAGQLPSDQTYVILSLRLWTYFDGTSARDLYQQTISQCYMTLNIGDKPNFQCPAWYMPSGGGVFGFDGGAPIYNNGLPSQEAILKLARPLIVPVRQNFNVVLEFFPVGTTDVLTLLNGGADDDQKVVLMMLDGLQTRDVQ